MKSMTGYGKASWEEGSCQMEVEIRCVNGKNFKMTTKLPPEFGCYEGEIKKILNQTILRGSVSFTLIYKDENTSIHSINESLLKSYHKQLQRLSKELDLRPPSLRTLLELPGVIEPSIPSSLSEEKWERAKMLIQEAMSQLEKMRIQEGIYLEKEIMEYISRIESSVLQLEKQVPSILSSYHARLKNRLQELVNNEHFQYTESDILREVALLSDRVDITEEIVRLKSHLIQFRQLIQRGNDLGRPLEFLLQEIVRESNTASSKANDANCSSIVIEIKANVEKIREQIQNVE